MELWCVFIIASIEGEGRVMVMVVAIINAEFKELLFEGVPECRGEALELVPEFPCVVRSEGGIRRVGGWFLLSIHTASRSYSFLQ